MRLHNLAKLAIGAVLAIGLSGITDARAEYPEKPITLILRSVPAALTTATRASSPVSFPTF